MKKGEDDAVTIGMRQRVWLALKAGKCVSFEIPKPAMVCADALSCGRLECVDVSERFKEDRKSSSSSKEALPPWEQDVA